MKLSELNQEDYTLEETSSEKQGGILGAAKGTVEGLSNIGVGIGTELGKGGLGLAQLSLKAAQKVTGSVGLKRTSGFLGRAAEETETIKKKVYDEPFRKQLDTGLGKTGEFIGMGAEFLAPTKAIISGQKILSTLSQPLATKRFLGTASKIASRALPEAIGAGGVELARTGGDVEEAKKMAIFAGATSGVLTGAHLLAKGTFWPELRESTARALGIQGKTTGGRVLPQLEKKVSGLATLKKYSPQVTVKDAHNFEKPFTPEKATFHETLQAWNKTRQMIFDKYSTISQKVGQQNVVDISTIADDLTNITSQARTGTYKNAARSMLQDLVDNFGQYDDAGQLIGFRKVAPKEVEIYLKDLYGEAGATLAGRADKAHGEIAATTATKLRQFLDDIIEKASGPEYGQLRGEYSSLKSIEDDLVRKFQQEARQLGGGLTDYVNVFSSGDVIAGILAGQPQFIAKGMAQGTLATLFKNLKRPDRYLQRAFTLIDQKAADPVIERLFGASRKLTEREQKLVESAQNYLKNPKLGMSVEDVSKTPKAYSWNGREVSKEQFDLLVKQKTIADKNKILRENKEGKTTPETLIKGATVSIPLIVSQIPSTTTYERILTENPEQNIKVGGRGVEISPQDIDVLRPLIYGEISNRPEEKKELEARVILNTALNRMQEFIKAGKPKTLAEILSMPNQYQAFEGEQYQNYSTTSKSLDVEKKKQVDEIIDRILEEIKKGEFKDNTNKAFYYIHNKDGSITYDDIKPLFK